MTQEAHPLSRLELRTFTNDVWGAVTFFGTGKAFPIYFRGGTEYEAVEKAEQFRRETLEKYEKAYLARRKAAVEAAERRRRQSQTAKKKG